MTTENVPYHAHIYYEWSSRSIAERLHQQFSSAETIGESSEVLFVGDLRDKSVGPHPAPQFEIHFFKGALPKILPLITASGLTALIHPLTNDDLADHTSLATWIGDPLPLELSVLDPPGINRGIARFGKSDF